MPANSDQSLVVLKAQPHGWALAGELSFASVPGLLDKSQRELDFSTDLHLNLSGIEHADSAGLALLLEWLDLSRKAGGTLSLSQLPEALLDIARVSNVETLLPLE
jgi:phospholipid transport system transporter-binding protein